MLRAVDLANLRRVLMRMTELEAAALALQEAIERARDDMRRIITEDDGR